MALGPRGQEEVAAGRPEGRPGSAEGPGKGKGKGKGKGGKSKGAEFRHCVRDVGTFVERQVAAVE